MRKEVGISIIRRRIFFHAPEAALFMFLIIIERSAYPLLLLAAAAVHEIGHIAAARIAGAKLEGGSAGLLGMNIRYDCRSISYGKEILICAGGIIFNIAGALLSVPLYFNRYGFFFIISNITLAFINILPVSILDGGGIMRCFFKILFDEIRAERIADIISCVFSVIIWIAAVYIQIRLGGNLSLFIISLYLMISSVSSCI